MGRHAAGLDCAVHLRGALTHPTAKTQRATPCHTPGMKRALTALAVMGLASMGILTAPAHADVTTDLRVLPRWSSEATPGHRVVPNDQLTRLVAAHGVPITPWISCLGETCLPTRPARIEMLRGSTWVTWSTGTLAELEDPTRKLTSKTTATILLRAVLPAHESLPETVGSTYTLSFLPGTSVRISGPGYIPASKANDYTALFRPWDTSITVQITPAAPGRKVLLNDFGVEGHPLIAELTTDSRGRATFRGDLSGVTTLEITVLPTKKRAGWYIDLQRSVV